jgi:hypothetical protein
LLALSLGGSFGAYQYLKQEDPPGIERVQPQLFRGKLNAEQKLRFAYIEKAIERAKVCSLYAWPVLETLNEASRLTRTPAKFLLSTMVVESRGDCSAIPWVYDKEQKVFIPASSAYGPVQMLEGTRREVSKKILNDPNIRKLTFLPTELTAPFLDDESVKRNVENYLNSTKSINENLGLNFVFAGEYYQQLLKHYKNLRDEEQWHWAILAWYTGPGAADSLLESLRESRLPLLPDEAFKNFDREMIANALSKIPGQGGWTTARKHYFKMMDITQDSREYLKIKSGKRSN